MIAACQGNSFVDEAERLVTEPALTGVAVTNCAAGAWGADACDASPRGEVE
ncbi:MAG: hypothetical protein ACTHOU_08315 [Aureliella sp.]